MQIRDHADEAVGQQAFTKQLVYLDSLSIHGLRCLERVELSLDSKRNVFIGDNGAGKTSLLEAIYLLGRGHSFRTANSRRLIQDERDQCVVRAQVQNAHGRLPVGILKTADATRVKLGQDTGIKLSELARACPVLVLEPGQHRLVEDGPVLRRRFLDWSVFHVEHAYHEEWRRFSRALKQRNALLRTAQHAMLPTWTRELVSAALKVDQFRRQVFQELLPLINHLLTCFLGEDHGLRIQYRSGWLADSSLEEQYAKQLSQDVERGFTQSGPHRAEIRVSVERHAARDCLSRGQQKLLITAMLLGQAQHFAQRNGISPILLIDDLGSELGQGARATLYEFLKSYSGQIFVTALDADQIPDEWNKVAKMFHVKHGLIEAMV